MTISWETIVSVLVAAIVSITTVVFTRYTAKETNKTASEIANTHSREQVESSYMSIITVQKEEVERLVNKISILEARSTSLESVITGLQRIVDTTVAKDREIARLKSLLEEKGGH